MSGQDLHFFDICYLFNFGISLFVELILRIRMKSKGKSNMIKIRIPQDSVDPSPFNRVQMLINSFFKNKPSLCIERAVIFTDVFRETEGEPIIIRRAKAFKRYCLDKKIKIISGELIVGSAASKPRAAIFCPEHATGWLIEELDELPTRHQDPYEVTEEKKCMLRGSIFPYWKGKCTSDYWLKHIPAIVKEIAVKTGIIDVEIKTQSAPGEIAPYYEMLLRKGFNGIKKEAEQFLSKLDYSNPEHYPKINFYQASILCIEGIIKLAERYSERATKQMNVESNQSRKLELQQIAEICKWVSGNPPRTFWEALQLIWFAQIGCYIEGNGPSYSPGRVDQYLYPYYKTDLEKGSLTDEKALELIECLYVKFPEHTWFLSKNASMYFAGYQPYQGICVGGVTRNGKDATNELSYLFITAKMHVRLHSPSLSVRVHKQTPEKLLFKAAELSKTGTGFPAYHSDEVTIKMLLSTGALIEDARDYSLVGCVEPYVPGKMSKWTDGGHYNFASAIEFVLTNGKSLINGNKQIGLATGDPKIMSFDEIKDAVKQQLAYFIKHIATACHITERAHADLTPYPYISSLIENCLEKGKDITIGGALYTVGPAFIGTGIADLANSLSAIKKHVYEEKSISMGTLVKAITNNFEGFEDLRLKMLNQTPMYGNDDDQVDEFVREMTDHAYHEISKYNSFRGPKFISGLYPVASHVPHGLVVSALPYGRLATTPLADGCSPKGGTDKNGPTAVLKSVSKINHDTHVAGTLLNMRFDPSTVEGENGTKRIASLLRSFVDLNIYHIQFNSVSSDLLINAQNNPDEYRSLIIRVAGYSAYFVELCKEMQDDIIQRTVHKL